MKLWQRILIVSLTFVTTAVSVTAIFVLYTYFSASVEREKKSANALHEYFSSAIKNNIIYERTKQDQTLLIEDDVKQIISSYIFSTNESNQYSGMHVTHNKEVITHMGVYTNTMKSFTEDQMTEGKYYSIIEDEVDRTYLTTCSTIKLEDKMYCLYTATDLTDIYSIYNSRWNFIIIVSVLLALVISILLLLVCIGMLRPLNGVNDTLRKIADGEYQKRVAVKGTQEIQEISENINLMAESIEDNIDTLQHIADSRKVFIDNLAHEMKTPLTSIMCFADLLRIKKRVSDEERIEYSGIIVEEAKHMKNLSAKILELATTGGAELEFKRVSVDTLIDDVQLIMTPIVTSRNINIEASSDGGYIWVDIELFKSLLYNLIDNAFKASTNGQTIQIISTSTKQSITITVVDNGIGMPEAVIKKVTEPFFMVDKSRSRKSGGSGLGLALCVEIAKQHNASLTIKSKPGEGTTVIVKIPNDRRNEGYNEKEQI